MTEPTDAQRRFAQAEEIFRAVIQLDPPERTQHLDRACAGDAELRRNIESLLDAEFDLPTCFEDSALADAARERARAALDDCPQDDPIDHLPDTIGPYTILAVLGQGGMGIVYLAEQAAPKRQVAIKVLRSVAMSAALQRRFRHEARALSRLDHPGIARILEAGIDEGGRNPQPYLAMEYVPGQTLADWAGDPEHTTHDRLRLVAAVCDAVQHAHQKGVIHRDLKPANIIVDHEGNPHVVDFGVARIAGKDDAATTLATNPGQLVGTIQYMSPEQIEANPDDLDTRSDVYALGVILHEVLAGTMPWELTDRSVYEVVRIVRDEMPTRLRTVDRQFRGDIDIMVARAMERDRARRYQSAREFATDIRLHLTGRPINARRDSVAYVVSRQLRRHRVAIVVTIVGLALIAFAASQAGLRWLKQTQSAGVFAVMGNSDGISDPFTLDRPTLARLDAAAQWADDELDGDKRQAARLHRLIGIGFFKHAKFETARDHLESSRELCESLYPAPHAERAAALHHLANVLYFLDDWDGATALYEEALSMRRDLRHRYADDSEEAKQFDFATSESINGIAACLRQQGHLQEAREQYEQALTIRETLELKRWVAASLNNIGTCLSDLQQWDDSRARYQAAFDLIAPLEISPIFVSRAHRNLARCLSRLGRADEAIVHAEMALGIASDVEGQGHREVLRCRQVRADCLRLAGQLDEAETGARALLAHLEGRPNISDADLADVRILLGRIALDAERPQDAVHLLEEGLAAHRRSRPDHPATLELQVEYATCLTLLQRYPVAERQLRNALTASQDDPDVGLDLRLSVFDRLIALYDVWGQTEEAARYREQRGEAANPG